MEREIYIVGHLPALDGASQGLVFTHDLANALRNRGHSVIVVAQRGAWCDPDARYEQANIWQPGSAGCFVSIYRFLRARRARVVNIQHDSYVFGSLTLNALFLVFLALCRLRGMRVVTTMYNAMSALALREFHDAGSFARKGIVPLLFFGYRFLVVCVGLLSSEVVVAHPLGLKAFPRSTRTRVSFIPLVAVPRSIPASEVERVRAEYALPERYVLFFGSLSRYKGVEAFIEAARALSDRISFVITGAFIGALGEGSEAYRYYYEQTRADAERAKIRWLGYIPERNVNPLLKGCRALVLPYIAAGGSSGPLATGASLDVPMLVSPKLEVSEFSEVGIEPTGAGVRAAIERLLDNSSYSAAVVEAGRRFVESHSAEAATTGYVEALLARA